MAVMPFATGTHVATSLAVDTEYLENLYPEISQTGKSVSALYLRPGLAQIYNFGANPLRGVYVAGDSVSRFTLYTVHFNGLVRLDTGQPPVVLGQLDTTENPVYMTGNGRQILITDGVNGYLYDIAADSFQKLDSGTHGWTLQQPRFVTYLSTYFVAMDAVDGRYYISAPFNGLSWNAADFGVAETDPDGMVCVVAEGGELWLFGTRTTEIHYNSGAADFPFAPKLSATLEWGTPAPFTVQKIGGSIAFLAQSAGSSLRVFVMNGYAPQRISDDALESRLSELTRVDDASAIAFERNGQSFYMLTFPTDDVSWCFNAQSGQWFRVKSNGNRYAGLWGAARENSTLVTDYRDGRLYEVADSGSDDDAPIGVRVVGKTINEREQWIPHRNLQVVCEHGTAPSTGDPQAMLRWSNDNGFTWSAGYWRGLGRIGEYRRRARWNRLGRARNRTYEVSITDAAPKVIVGMVLNGGA